MLVKPIAHQTSISKFGDAVKQAAVIPPNMLLATLLRTLIRDAKVLRRLIAHREDYVEHIWLGRLRNTVKHSSHGGMQANVPDQRPRANDSGIGTETQSRGS